MSDPEHEPEIRRLWISMIDLTEAWDSARHLQDLRAAQPPPAPAVERALWAYAVVAYARPFKTNRPANGTAFETTDRVEKATLQGALSPSELALHERIINIRDQMIAHSDAAHVQAVVERRPRQDPTQVTVGSVKRFGKPSTQELDAFVSLVPRVLSVLQLRKAAISGKTKFNGSPEA